MLSNPLDVNLYLPPILSPLLGEDRESYREMPDGSIQCAKASLHTTYS